MRRGRRSAPPAEAAASATAEPAASAEARLHELEKRGRQLCDGFHKAAKAAGFIEHQWIIGTIKKIQEMVNRLELEIW